MLFYRDETRSIRSNHAGQLERVELFENAPREFPSVSSFRTPASADVQLCDSVTDVSYLARGQLKRAREDVLQSICASLLHVHSLSGSSSSSGAGGSTASASGEAEMIEHREKDPLSNWGAEQQPAESLYAQRRQHRLWANKRSPNLY